ncbi:MAG: aminotransferase class I/II-fold pyridoxal phosphate-dependent enzyme [Chloroflexi bacterium]|nr:aminotransferase class I/II-fold pyridoxal phosphate-dependent enzyme [Chloroflexota bacterium]
MTRLSLRYGGINLSQGFPDFPAPEAVKEAAARAIREDANQYTVTWGLPELRAAVAEKVRAFNGIAADPDREVTITCGAAEALLAALLSCVETGDEVVIIEPFFESYVPDVLIAGGTPVFVPLRGPAMRWDADELRQAFSRRTRAIVVNTPHNPAGRVLTRDELGQIAELCRAHDAIAITDEIYEHIVYDGREHVSLATLPGMAERTITISGFSKTFSVTGWRLGWAVAPAPLSDGLRKVHDYATVCAPRPLQQAALAALALPPSYYDALRADYTHRRDLVRAELEGAGFRCTKPEGAYYVLADFSAIRDVPDRAFVEWMAAEVGVIGVPGSAFYHHKELGERLVRFAFPKRDETLHEAGARLRRLAAVVT